MQGFTNDKQNLELHPEAYIEHGQRCITEHAVDSLPIDSSSIVSYTVDVKLEIRPQELAK